MTLGPRVWLGTVGRPVAARAVPTWLGVAVVAGVVMGGNGMSPRDIVVIASSSVRGVLVLALAWLLLSSAAVRVGFGAPGAGYLRSLPGGPPWHALAVIVAAAAVHVPWAVVWFAGGGPLWGALAWGAMTAVSLAIVVGAGAIVRAPRVPVWRAPLAALVGAYGRGLTRRRLSALLAGAGLAALGGAFAALVIGHEAEEARDAAIIAAACSALAVAAALVAATFAIAEADRQVEWLAVAAGVPLTTRRLARMTVLVAIGEGAALVATAATRGVVPMGATMFGAVAAANALIGLGLGLGAVEIAARARREDRIDGVRVVVGSLLLGVVALVSIGVFHAAGIAVFVAVGAGLAAGGRR